MNRADCNCLTPLQLSDDPGHCIRCGHTTHHPSASTHRLATAISEIAQGTRKLSNRTRTITPQRSA